MTYEAADWRTPDIMARALVRRHRDLSTVHAMVTNEFGRAPSLERLKSIRDAAQRLSEMRDWRFNGTLDRNPVNYSNEQHHAAMEQGSEALRRAIVRALARKLDE